MSSQVRRLTKPDIMVYVQGPLIGFIR